MPRDYTELLLEEGQWPHFADPERVTESDDTKVNLTL
jgi:hypothetical protein